MLGIFDFIVFFPFRHVDVCVIIHLIHYFFNNIFTKLFSPFNKQNKYQTDKMTALKGKTIKRQRRNTLKFCIHYNSTVSKTLKHKPVHRLTNQTVTTKEGERPWYTSKRFSSDSDSVETVSTSHVSVQYIIT